MKRPHLRTGAGHYGVFSGSRWETQIYPVIRSFVLASEAGSRPDAFSIGRHSLVLSGLDR